MTTIVSELFECLMLIGCIIAGALSYVRNNDIVVAIGHTIIGWFYVLYVIFLKYGY